MLAKTGSPPEASNNAADKKRLVGMSNNVSHLALTLYFTQGKCYAEKTAEHVRVWFLHPVTRMNSNMVYVQATPGVNTGRDTGIIDTRLMVNVIDTIERLPTADTFNKTEYKA